MFLDHCGTVEPKNVAVFFLARFMKLEKGMMLLPWTLKKVPHYNVNMTITGSNVRWHYPPGSTPYVDPKSVHGPTYSKELLARNDDKPQYPYLSPTPKVSKATRFAADFIREQRRFEAEDLYFE